MSLYVALHCFFGRGSARRPQSDGSGAGRCLLPRAGVSVPLQRECCWIDVRTGRLLDIRPMHWREHAVAVFKGGLVRCCSKKTPSSLRVSYLNQNPHVRRQKPSSY